MRVLSAALVLSPVLAACAVGPAEPAASAAQAITHGTGDPGDASVVALVRDGALACTGTLIAPRVVLTAAHCIDDGGRLRLPRVFFGATWTPGAPTTETTYARVAPSFDRPTLTGDVALVVLADPAPAGSQPSPWAAPADAVELLGATVRVVGFGATDGTEQALGSKRSGSARVVSVESERFRLGSDASLTCGGDSGGPAFAEVGGVERVVGITSSGDLACASYGEDTRVDAFDGFVAAFVARAADGAAQPGAPCFYDGHCAAGATCVVAEDDPTVRYCAAACARDADCPDDTSCNGGACRYAPPTPTAFGASCDGDEDCASEVCAHADGALGTCSVACWPGAVGCPGGTTCQAVSSDRAPFACIAARHDATVGGCAAAGGGASGLVTAALALLAAALARRGEGKGSDTTCTICVDNSRPKSGRSRTRCPACGRRPLRRVRSLRIHDAETWSRS